MSSSPFHFDSVLRPSREAGWGSLCRAPSTWVLCTILYAAQTLPAKARGAVAEPERMGGTMSHSAVSCGRVALKEVPPEKGAKLLNEALIKKKWSFAFRNRRPCSRTALRPQPVPGRRSPRETRFGSAGSARAFPLIPASLGSHPAREHHKAKCSHPTQRDGSLPQSSRASSASPCLSVRLQPSPELLLGGIPG